MTVETNNSISTIAPNRGYRLVRITVAGLLLTASVLKCSQLATEPVIGTGLLDSRWLLMATVEGELLFGLWLLADVWAKPTWAAAIACFGLFACVSLCKAISGHTSCGCFGRVQVNPWYTGGLDLAVVASLLHWRPKESFFTFRRAIVVLVIWLAVGVPAALAMGSYNPTIASDAADISDSKGHIIVLSPRSWLGKPFPLLTYVQDSPSRSLLGLRPLHEDLTDGDWLVLFYHHDCPNCRGAIAKYERLAREPATHATPIRIALIEMPPYSGQQAPLDVPCIRGRLSNDKDWLMATPVLLRLSQGVVLTASEGKKL